MDMPSDRSRDNHDHGCIWDGAFSLQENGQISFPSDKARLPVVNCKQTCAPSSLVGSKRPKNATDVSVGQSCESSRL